MTDKATKQKRETIAALQAQISRTRQFSGKASDKADTVNTKMQSSMTQNKSIPDFVGVAG